MSVEFEVVLVTGDRRTVVLPSHTGSLGNALDRLDAWIQTKDGGWVQKGFIVEVRPLEPEREAAPVEKAVGKRNPTGQPEVSHRAEPT